MTRDEKETASILHRLRSSAAACPRTLAFMEVCGTHTMSAFRCGLASVLPKNVRLISGPGCPVCVTAQGEIDRMIELARRPEVTLCTYGDMVRVPGRRGSLEAARREGARVQIVYSSLDAVARARAEPARRVVFAAVGFETTAPATAAALLAARRLDLANFTVLASHKRIIPAMRALLQGAPRSGLGLDGFLCPGHVSVIIGQQAYEPLVREFNVACVIGGFEPVQILRALADLVDLARDHRAALINQYPEAVTPEGNQAARKLLDTVFQAGPARWRGLGEIAQSGMIIRESFARFDARRVFQLSEQAEREPASCLCGKVISGLALPPDCKLFGRGCTPISPIGPCMVSSEGTCAAWFKYGPRDTGGSPGRHTLQEASA